MNIFFQIIYGGFFQNLIARMPISFAFFIAVIQAVGQKVDFLIMRVKKAVISSTAFAEIVSSASKNKIYFP